MPDGAIIPNLPAIIPSSLDDLLVEVNRLHLAAQRSTKDALAQAIAAGRSHTGEAVTQVVQTNVG